MRSEPITKTRAKYEERNWLLYKHQTYRDNVTGKLMPKGSMYYESHQKFP